MTTGGLRIQLDSDGNHVVPGSKADPVSIPPAVENLPSSIEPRGSIHSGGSKSATAPAGPQVIKSATGQATVVRLNGMFRAGSRAVIGPDGKLHGDCHIDSEVKGTH